MFRRLEDRVMQRFEVELHVALLGHLARVQHGLWDFGEKRLHLLRRAQVELLLHVTHPLGVAQERLRAEADEAVVRVAVLAIDVVDVVRGDALQAEFLRPRDEVLVHLRLFGDAVVLEFEIEVLRAHRLLEPIERRAGLGEVILDDGLGNLAGETARERDQALAVRGEDFLVDARLVVIALQMGRGRELDEVFVAHLVLRQEHEMIVNIAATAAAAGLLLQPAARCDIDFATDDGLDALLPRRLVEINRAIEHAVVGERKRGELQFVRAVDQLVEPAGAVEQAVFGVKVEMDKVRMRHRPRLPPGGSAVQGGDVHRDFPAALPSLNRPAGPSTCPAPPLRAHQRPCPSIRGG